MAGSGVTLYSTTSAGNKTVIGTIDWREDVYMPSQINDNLGQIMADIRAMANAVATGWIEIGDGDGTYTATYVSATSFRFDGVDVTAYYRAGMRVRVVAPTPGTLSGTITSSAFSTHTTLVVAWDSGGLSNEAITSVSLGIGSGGGSGAAASYRNILGRNGGFEVWQRGAGGSAGFSLLAATSQYISDGWYANVSAITDIFQSGIALSNGSRYSCVVQRRAGQTAVGFTSLEFPLDTDEIVRAAGNLVTLSVQLIAGANFSPAGGAINAKLYVGTGAPAKRISGAYTGETIPLDATFAITGTNTRFTATSTTVIPGSATQASLLFSWTPVGTAGAQDSFNIDDVQLEIGSVATPFERRPFEQELLACQRHYQKSFSYTTAPAQNVGPGAGEVAYGTLVAGVNAAYSPMIRFPVTMRIAPTVTLYNPEAVNAQVRNRARGLDHTTTVASNVSPKDVIVFSTGSAAGIVSDLCAVHYQADAGI